MEHETEQFERLWTDYLEGDLDEAGIAELREILSKSDECSQRAEHLYRFHRLLGFLAKDNEVASDHFVKKTMKLLPKDSKIFTEDVVKRQQKVVSLARESEASCQVGRNRVWTGRGAVAWMCAACVALAATGWFWNKSTERRAEIQVVEESGAARITRLSQAKFFGELSPRLNSTVPIGKEFTLIEGMMELRFQQGAEVIIEAPAVFQVKEGDLLIVDMGVCSVYAPPGAEGFRVVTPESKIVDLGTRFSVKVDENNKTEVQMIEGLADVYPVMQNGPESGTPEKIRLAEKQALMMHNLLEPETSPVTFDRKQYRSRLPDRIISYEASRSAKGLAENLQSVTVQRGAEEITYSVDEIIGADVTWFKADDDISTDYLLTAPVDMNSGGKEEETLCVTRYDYLMTAPGAEAPAWTLLADHSLLTGTINPGGSATPLTTDPVINRDIFEGIEGTPGLAIRFHQPVVNGPGPDVVFFELQPVIYPEGDSFHVSPLHFKTGLRSHTIRNYDLNLHSSEALRVTQPHVHFSDDQVANSLDDLGSMQLQTRPTKLIYRAVAVGIDLSDLGYALGEQVEGLFFQDAVDDQFHIDPVFIGGLPSR